MLKRLWIMINMLRLWPHYVVWKCCSQRSLITADLAFWVKILRSKEQFCGYDFFDIITFFPEFRNLFYARVKVSHKILPHLLKLLAAPQALLNISAANIGGGLYIQHGFATIIDPCRIGTNAWINQNVTIGYTNATDCPTLGNYVTIGAGAKILGNCTIGDHVVIGANCVVVKDVPDNCVVVGVPAYIIKQNGVKVYKKL